MGETRVIILGGNAFLVEGVKSIISCLAMPENMFVINNGGVIECLVAGQTDFQRTIIIAPQNFLKVISLFPDNISVIAVCSTISIVELIQLLKNRAVNKIHLRSSYIPRLTNIERRYCLLSGQGVSVEQMAIIFHCGPKNISNIKVKVMKKWGCKNTLDFYKLLLKLLEII